MVDMDLRGADFRGTGLSGVMPDGLAYVRRISRRPRFWRLQNGTEDDHGSDSRDPRLGREDVRIPGVTPEERAKTLPRGGAERRPDALRKPSLRGPEPGQ